MPKTKSEEAISNKSHTEKDLGTCLIIAGCSGAGKSTIVKYSHALDVQLYGKDFHKDFKSTWSELPYQEFDHYSDAIVKGSTFEGRLICSLDSKGTPKNILMHVDLKLLTAVLGYKAASDRDKKIINSITKVPIPQNKRADPKICDLMVSSFLKHKYFSRFKRIVVNTVVTDHKTSYLQRLHRQYKGEKIASTTEIKVFAREHRAMYKAWEKNIYRLKPTKILFTTVGKDGNLYSNNECICVNWTTKTGFKKPRAINFSKIFNIIPRRKF